MKLMGWNGFSVYVICYLIIIYFCCINNVFGEIILLVIFFIILVNFFIIKFFISYVEFSINDKLVNFLFDIFKDGSLIMKKEFILHVGRFFILS